ncbi:hypothetical protein OAH34_03490 [bacterium]|nr:hypothetical protein [bacterium]
MQTLPCRPTASNWSCSIIVSITFVAVMGCDATMRSVTREARPLAYVGQVEFGEPTNEAGQVVVPLKYVGGAWIMSPAIVPINVDATVINSEIEITIETSVATDDQLKMGHKLILPKGSNGEYVVYYRDPDGTRHQIGNLRIEE